MRQVLVLHPDFVMAQLTNEEFDQYAALRSKRYRLSLLFVIAAACPAK